MLWIPDRRCDSNKYPQHIVLWRNKSFLHFNTNARFPQVYYNVGANLGLLLNGGVSVMIKKMCHLSKQNTFFSFRTDRILSTQNEIKLSMPPIIAK